MFADLADGGTESGDGVRCVEFKHRQKIFVGEGGFHTAPCHEGVGGTDCDRFPESYSDGIISILFQKRICNNANDVTPMIVPEFICQSYRYFFKNSVQRNIFHAIILIKRIEHRIHVFLLPDDEYVPSELHEKLLNLGWKDVFTTNYDTLLERTLEQITERHYSVILNKEDLIYSSEPRIIKLHGSFPSTLPFVITEEDYRQYPKKSAIFVNTVQQTLIENVLCLVGFSGDDPNFLQWLGWIRDNIGKDIASKIYLVGVFKFSTAQLNLLNARNIVVLNMSKCDGIGSGDYYAGLELFFNGLSQLTKEKDDALWPYDSLDENFDYDETDVNEKVKTIIKNWEYSRNEYPGWLIPPSDHRKSLLLKTEYYQSSIFYHIYKGHLSGKVAFNFLYEYNWRINKCLKPIMRTDIGVYEKILFSINPFPNIITFSTAETIYDKVQPDWADVS